MESSEVTTGAAGDVFAGRLDLQFGQGKNVIAACASRGVRPSRGRMRTFSECARKVTGASPGFTKSLFVWSAIVVDLANVASFEASTRKRTGKPKPGVSGKSVGRAGIR